MEGKAAPEARSRGVRRPAWAQFRNAVLGPTHIPQNLTPPGGSLPRGSEAVDLAHEEFARLQRRFSRGTPLEMFGRRKPEVRGVGASPIGFAMALAVAVLVLLVAPSCGSSSSGMSLRATPVNAGTVSLNWSPPSNATNPSYAVYRDGVRCCSTSKTSVELGGHNPSTRYCFRVSAVVWPFVVATSNTACATTPANLPPSAPTDVVATAVSPARIDLSWTASSDDLAVTGYRIRVDGVDTAVVAATATSAPIENLWPATTYCLEVIALDKWDESAPSTEVRATTPPDVTPPTAPTGVRASWFVGEGGVPGVFVSWEPSTDDGVVQSYMVFRDGLQRGAPAGTSYTDVEIAPRTGYSYLVRAVDRGDNVSAPSDSARVTTSWSWARIAAASGGIFGEWTSLGLDRGNRARVAHFDWDYDFELRREVGQLWFSAAESADLASAWTHEPVLLDLRYWSWATCALAIGTDDAEHLAFGPGLAGIGHATRVAGGWIQETIDDCSNSSEVAIAAGTSGALRVAYRCAGAVMVATRGAGGVWTTELVDDTGSVLVGGTRATAIAFDMTNGATHLAYTVFDLDPQLRLVGRLEHAVEAGGGWSPAGVDAGLGIGAHLAIAVDPAGHAHLSYRDDEQGDLKYATNATGAWVAQSIDVEGDVGAYTSIAVHTDGTVHISCLDATRHELRHATNASGAWRTSTIDGSGQVTGFTSIAVRSDGRAVIAYRTPADLRIATDAER